MGTAVDITEPMLPPAAEEAVEGIADGFEMIPPWKEQITVRGLVISALRGCRFCIIIHKLNLTISYLGDIGRILDYPPLTTYQSLAHVLHVNAWILESLSLTTSRGFESHGSKLLMRWTMLVPDFLVFFLAVVCFVVVYCKRFGGNGRERSGCWL